MIHPAVDAALLLTIAVFVIVCVGILGGILFKQCWDRVREGEWDE